MLTLLLLKKIWSQVVERGERIGRWALQNHTAVIIILLAFALFLFLWWRSEKPQDIQIVMPSQEIKELERQNEERVKNILDEIDRKREEDDSKIAEAAKSPTPRKKNITAEELERIVNGKK